MKTAVNRATTGSTHDALFLRAGSRYEQQIATTVFMTPVVK